MLGLTSMGAASRERELTLPLFLAVVKSLLSSQITTAKERWIYTGADPATGKVVGLQYRTKSEAEGTGSGQR